MKASDALFQLRMREEARNIRFLCFVSGVALLRASFAHDFASVRLPSCNWLLFVAKLLFNVEHMTKLES